MSIFNHTKSSGICLKLHLAWEGLQKETLPAFLHGARCYDVKPHFIFILMQKYLDKERAWIKLTWRGLVVNLELSAQIRRFDHLMISRNSSVDC